MRIAIDFDGTIVFDEYPKIGQLKPNAKEVMQRLTDDGHTIIINSCRDGQFEREAMAFLKEQGVPFHFFNENDPELCKVYDTDCRKMSADLYIDDKQLGGIPDDWEDIYQMILFGRVYVQNVVLKKGSAMGPSVGACQIGEAELLVSIPGAIGTHPISSVLDMWEKDLEANMSALKRAGVTGPIGIIGGPKHPIHMLGLKTRLPELFDPKLGDPYISGITKLVGEHEGEVFKDKKPHQVKKNPLNCMKKNDQQPYTGPRNKSKRKKGGKR